MDSEQHHAHYELRSRSRSRSHTPMIPSRPLPESEIIEHHYDLRNKSRERSHTPGEVTSSRSGSTRLFGSGEAHEKNMESIQENKEEESVMESPIDNQSTKSQSSTASTRRVERRSERQRAKKQIFANGQSESKEDTSDEIAEQKRKSATPHKIVTSDYSSEEGEKEDPLSRPRSTYEFYKQAGDWWNVFPKTDYTYSKASKCRYEVAPGILAIPNMSRRSIHSDGSNTISERSFQTSERTMRSERNDSTEISSPLHSFNDNYDISHARAPDSQIISTVKNVYVERYMNHKEIVHLDPRYLHPRQRYFSQNTSSRCTNMDDTFQYDSDIGLDEMDSFASIKPKQKWRIMQWFTYFTAFITVWSRKINTFIKFKISGQKRYNSQTYHTYNESKWRTLWKSLDYYSHKIYFFFVRMLVFDAWLLSQFAGTRKWFQDKTTRILWITLSLLLLPLGAYVVQEHFFTCVDFLRNVQYGVTETTYHIFNDINLISFDYGLLAKYIANLKYFSMHLLPNVNVSLFEISPIG